MTTDSMNMRLPQAVAHHAGQRPNDPFVQEVDGAERSWGEALDTSLRWADALDRAGVETGRPVVSLLPNGIEAVVSWIACAWLRAIEAPLNTSYKGSWLTHAINLTGAEMAFVDAQFMAEVVAVAPDLDHLKTVVVFGEHPVEASGSLGFDIVPATDFFAEARPTPRDGPDVWDLAALIFTSGTTGPSKAVMVPWGQFQSIRHIDWDQAPGPHVQYSPFAPYHVTGKGPVFGAATDGGRVVLRDGFSTDEFWTDVREYGCTTMVMMAPMALFLMAQPERPDDADNTLGFVLMGPLIPDVEAFAARFGVKVQTAYNMTELNVPANSTGLPVTDATHRTCGRIRQGVDVRIVDEHDFEVPPNTPGEMIVRGEPWTMNLGYWGMPDKTAEAWRNGWFHTGDTFVYDEDGFLYFQDRAKDYIRRRGENISSFEVEACVNTHPDVVESAAVAVASDEGEDEVKVAAVLRPGAELTPEEFVEFLVPRMPRFAVPRYVEFVDELPKTQATQRVQKAKVREAGVGPTTWDRVAAGLTVPRGHSGPAAASSRRG